MAYDRTFRKTLALAALCAAMILPATVSARPGFGDHIPNGDEVGKNRGGNNKNCALCHTSVDGGGGEANASAFGSTVRGNLIDGKPDWSQIYDKDPDNDGFTSGQELCDPNGTFTINNPAPDCDFTDPNDPNDFPQSVNPVDMGMDMNGATDMGGDMAADLGAEDMGPDLTPDVDMNTPEEDMDVVDPREDMSTGGGSDMNTGGGSDMAIGADMNQETPIPEEEDDGGCGGCGQSGSGSPAGGLGLLGLLGAFGLWRRRAR